MFYDRELYSRLFKGREVREVSVDASNVWYFRMQDGGVVVVEATVLDGIIPVLVAKEGHPPQQFLCVRSGN
jgi:hypothetical protein